MPRGTADTHHQPRTGPSGKLFSPLFPRRRQRLRVEPVQNGSSHAHLLLLNLTPRDPVPAHAPRQQPGGLVLRRDDHVEQSHVAFGVPDVHGEHRGSASSPKRSRRRHGGSPRRDHERPRAIAAVRLHRLPRHRREIRAEPHAIADAALGEDPVPQRVQGHAPRDGQSRDEASDAFQVRRQRRLSRPAALDELARPHAVRQSLGPRGTETPRHHQRGVADQAHVEHVAAPRARPAIGAVESEGAHESHALALRAQRAVGEDQRAPDDAPRGAFLQRERRRERKHDLGYPQPPSASAVCRRESNDKFLAADSIDRRIDVPR